MDSITQAALGAVVGERVLGKHLGRKAMAWGALVGTLPDLDIVANPFLDLPGQLYWHRGLSHSILGMVVMTPVLGWLLHAWWRRGQSPRPSSKLALDSDPPLISLTRALVFVAVNLVTHILIDCFTCYGTQLFDPFSRHRVGLNNFFIIDPLFTYPLLIWITAALFGRRPPGRAGRGWVTVLSFLILGYTSFSFVAQAAAARRFDSELRAAGIDPIRGEISATPFNTLIWRGLFETEDAFWISYWALPDDEEPLVFHHVPKRLDRLSPYRGDRAIDCALWFSEEYALVEEDPESGGFLVTDLRFAELWPESAGGMPRSFFTWRLTPPKSPGTGWTMAPHADRDREIDGLFERLRQRWNGDRRALGPGSRQSYHQDPGPKTSPK